MQLRTLTLLSAIVGLLFSSVASALGLGEITLKSQFNQTLNAEIRLLKVRDLSKEEIVVSLASREDFRRAGVDRLFFLTGLDFEVVLDNPSSPIIRVKSKKPVTEPYLNFLVEVQWPSGRLLREYTLLLDLPVFNEAAPASSAVSSPSQSTRVESLPAQPRPTVNPRTTRPAPTSSSPAPTDSRPSTTGRTAPTTDRYRVQRGDTLWEIAEQVRPSRNFSVQQTMIAIQEVNPDAFVGGNINRLRNGRVLRIPSVSEIEEISFNQAVAAVRQQNQRWSDNASQKAPLTASAPSPSAPVTSTQPEGRLTLGAADSGQGNVQGSGASGSGDSLRNELSVAQEELDRSTRENAELKARVAELESQIETMEKLVAVTNEQLKALQVVSESGVDAEASEAAAVADDVISDTAIVQDSELSIDEPAVNDPAPVQEPEPVAATPAAPPVTTPAPVPTPVEAPSSGGFMDIIKDNLLAIGAVIVGLLLAILAVMRLRNKPDDNDIDDFSIDTESDQFVMDDNLDTDQPLDDLEPIAEIEDEDSVQAQTEDVVAEAEIYLGLGQENKAIELLQKEIQQNPDNAEARLGLLKIYAKAQNAEAFDDQYAQLLPLGNESANGQATALRQEITDIEPFATEDYSPEVTEPDSLQIDDLDELTANSGGDLEDSLDLDLDLDLPDDSLEPVAEMSLSDDDLDTNLGELSLELDDLSQDISDLEASSDELPESMALGDDLALDSGDDTSLDELIGDFDLDVDDIAIDLDDDDSLLEQELEVDLDSLDTDVATLDAGDTTTSVSEEFSGELDLDIDADFAKTLDETEALSSPAIDEQETEGLDFDMDLDELGGELAETALDVTPSSDGSLQENSELAVDFALPDDADELIKSDDELALPFENDEMESDVADELDLTTDLDDTDDFLASLDDEVESLAKPGPHTELPDQEELETATNVEESLDLDLPPAELDIESLDQEIDAMTAELDDMLPSDLSNELEEDAPDEIALAEELGDSDIESLMADESEDDLDFLSDSELDSSEEPFDTELDLESDIDLDLTEDVASEPEEIASATQESVLDLDQPAVEAVASGDGVEFAASLDDVASHTLEENELASVSASDDLVISEDDSLDFIEESDEVATKLDLARAYLDMGDHEGAHDILTEVMEEGTQQQKTEAEALLQQV